LGERCHGLARVPFDIVVPAHNEQSGIERTVRSLTALDYPAHLRRIVVVADNCTDETAERARAAGATVWVRTDPDRRGKGYALAYAFEESLRQGRAQALVVVDADTVVSSNLLQAFSARIDRGAQAMQAEYGVLNPEGSWRTRLMVIALTLFHTVRSLARERLHLSAGLRGNGMCFTSQLIRQAPHRAFSLVEDLEYGILLGELGHRVHYVAEAEVLGEMASSAAAARTQRRRWEQGRRALARRKAASLCWRGLSQRQPVLVDLGIDLLVPPLSTLAGISFLGAALAAFSSLWAGKALFCLFPWTASLALQAGYVLRGWWLSGTGARGFAALAWAPVFMAWKMIGMARPHRASSDWVRTAREGEAGR
jgi:cellulose synthase/poly-beta-1,6-N-acetylglucosamine synthase-like glycosyltransferase